MQRFSIPLTLGCLVAGLSTAHAASQATYTFPPLDLQNWSQVTIPGGTSEDYRFFATNTTFGNRINWQDPVGEGFGIGGLIVTTESDTDARGPVHNTAVLRSPSFTLNGLNASAGLNTFFPTRISFKLLGGGGMPTAPANVSALPAVSVDNGSNANLAYLGVGLRRVSDGAYLLWGRRSTNAQSAAWETITWDQATLAAATSGDAPGTLYTLDLIDAASGNWGWVAMDSASLISESTVITVSVKPQDIIGSEAGPDRQLSLRFSRDNDLTQPLTVTYGMEGTAYESIDYQDLPNPFEMGHTITIPAGQAFVDLPVKILPNSYIEKDRSATARVLTSSEYLVSPSANVATVWISDVPQTGLATVSGPLPVSTFLPFANPLTATSTGSLFIYGEGTYASGFMTLGIRTTAEEATTNGGVDLGRNNATAPHSIFDYLDQKGAASTATRVVGTPEIPINPGHYTIIGQVTFQTPTSGEIRTWIWDGTNGSLDYNTPNATTTFTSGFINTSDQLYLRLAGNATGTNWTNARVIWVEGTDATATQAAFAQLTPTRPFIYFNAPSDTAGEYGDQTDFAVSIFRSGPPTGELTLSLLPAGTATQEDFSAYPTSITIPSGQSTATVHYPVIADDLNEGTEVITVTLQEGTNWLPVSTVVNGQILDRPFQGWLATYFSGGGLTGPLADADGDGRTNLLEYFSGTAPTDPASGSTALLAPGSTATLRYQRDPAVKDAAGRVLWSTDLVHWQGSNETDGVRSATITETLVSTNESGIETIDAAVQVTGPSTPRIFLRLSVELP